MVRDFRRKKCACKKHLRFFASRKPQSSRSDVLRCKPQFLFALASSAFFCKSQPLRLLRCPAFFRDGGAVKKFRIVAKSAFSKNLASSEKLALSSSAHSSVANPATFAMSCFLPRRRRIRRIPHRRKKSWRKTPSQKAWLRRIPRLPKNPHSRRVILCFLKIRRAKCRFGEYFSLFPKMSSLPKSTRLRKIH